MLALIREGRLDAEIAVRLGVPIGDVKERVERIVRKLHLSERHDLLRPPEEIAAPRPEPDEEVIIDATGGATDGPVRSRWRGVAKVAGVAVLAAGGVGAAMWTWAGDRERAEPPNDGVVRHPPGVEGLVRADTPTAAGRGTADTPTPTPAAPAVINGVVVPEFTVTSSEAFPEKLVLYTFNPGVAQSGNAAGLFRTYRAAGSLRVERIFPPAESPAEMFTAAAAADASDIVVGLRPSPGARERIYMRSRDGGITWSEAFTLQAGGAVVAVANGNVLVAQVESNVFPRWLVFEDGVLRDAAAPAAAPLAEPRLDHTGGVAWLAARALLLDEAGDPVATFPWGGARPILSLQLTPDGWAVAWPANAAPAYVALFVVTGPQGEVSAALAAPTGGFLWPRVWVSNTLGVGSAFGFRSPGSRVPAVIHMTSAKVELLREPFLDPPFRNGLNEVVAAVAATVVRVNAPGDCLNFRSGPSSDTGSLDCVPHGALLISTNGDPGFADQAGQIWFRVRTLAGEEGWASGAYLEP